MKKLSMGLLVIISLLVFATGCDGGHEHVFSEDWSSDATFHWHACEVSGCSVSANKEKHSFVVDEEVTENSNYVCSVCGQEKADEKIKDATEWDSAFEEFVKDDNYTLKGMRGAIPNSELLSMLENPEYVWDYEVVVDGKLIYGYSNRVEQTVCIIQREDGTTVGYTKMDGEDSFRRLIDDEVSMPDLNWKGYFDKFTYNEETGFYNCSEKIIVDGIECSNIAVKFSDGEIEYIIFYDGDGFTYFCHDIGTSVVELPEEIKRLEGLN